MADIKLKEKVKAKEIDKDIKSKSNNIKNKRKIISNKDTIIKYLNKRKMQNKKSEEDRDQGNYATEKIENKINKFSNKATYNFNKYGYRSTKNIIEEIYNERLKNNKTTDSSLNQNNKNEIIQNKPNKVTINKKESIIKKGYKKEQTNNIENNNSIVNYDTKNMAYKKQHSNSEQMYSDNKSYLKQPKNIQNKGIDLTVKKNTNSILIKTKDTIEKGNTLKIKSKDRIHEIKSNTISNKIKKSNIVENKEKIVEQKILNSKEIPKYRKRIEEFIQKTKKRINNTKKIIKALITGTEKLIQFLMAGGWVVMLIIIIICLIYFITTSIFGIFISDKVSNNTVTIKSIMSELNNEFIDKLTSIQNQVPHDEFDITGNRANWKDIIAVFIVKYSDGDYRTELISLDDKKIKYFKKVFWEMNEITYTTEKIEKEVETKDEKGNIKKVKIKSTILHIVINSKNISDMRFSDKQKAMIEDILKDEYTSLWEQLLYGSSNGSTDIVEVARNQIGQVGGEPYWSWYGFNARVEWCACFVSWCANECGYIEKGIIPKFACCENEGVKWFQTCNLWQDNSYIPNTGDIIFFDWEGDGHSDHVGIVERVENNIVYTIEGNSSDMCESRKYIIGDRKIRGYGTLKF